MAISDGVIASVVTGVTALAGVLATYGVARGQRQMELERLSADQTEREATRQADAARAEAERLEVLVERRKALYLEYLRCLDEYVQFVAGTPSLASYFEWWRDFQRLDTQVDILGAEGMVLANRSVYAVLESVLKAAQQSDSFTAGVKHAFDQRREAFADARSAVIDAARADLSPHAPRAINA